MKEFAYDNFYTYKAFWLEQYEGELLIQLLPENSLDKITPENSLTFKSGDYAEVKAKYPEQYMLFTECMDILIHHQRIFTRTYQLVELDGVLYFNPYLPCPLMLEIA